MSACGSPPSTVAVYITLSGLLSAIFTEIIQFFLIWFGLFLVSVLGIVEIGGAGEIFARIPAVLRQPLVHFGRRHPERDVGHLGGDRPRPGLRSLLRLLDHGLPGRAAGLFGEGPALRPHDAHHRLVLQDGRPVHRRHGAAWSPWFWPTIPSAGFALLQDGGQDQLRLRSADADLRVITRRASSGLGVTALLAGFMAGQAGNVSAFNTVWTYDIYRVGHQ